MILLRIRLDHVIEPLSKKFISQIHFLSMSDTVDEHPGRVSAREYRTVTSMGRDRELLPARKINSPLRMATAVWGAF